MEQNVTLKVKGIFLLNLGCGINKREGYINIDKEAKCNPDVIWDLEQTPWPFETNSCEMIAATHVLEHLGQTTSVFLNIMREIHRILQPGGKLEIRVPPPTSAAFWDDPTHVRAITPGSLSLFSKKQCQYFKANNFPNTPLALYLDVDLEIIHIELKLAPYWNERWSKKLVDKGTLDFAVDSQWNVVEEYVITMIKPKLEP